MTSRWDVTKAVRASKLSAPARLVMLVLADVAEVGTAEIPEKWTPSLTVLEHETGLSRSTIKRQLSDLESAGWVVRTYPDGAAMRRGERIRYRLEVPGSTQDPDVGPQEPHNPRSTVNPGSTLDLGGVQGEPRGGSTVNPLIRSVPDLPDQEPSSSGTASRPDVDRICTYLADAIEANGSKRPTITKGWRTEARLLLDRDGRTVEQVIKAIDWCQSDEFWRGNVLSMPKLRQRYDQLRLAAQRSRASPNGSTVDRRVLGALAVADRLELLERREIGS